MVKCSCRFSHCTDYCAMCSLRLHCNRKVPIKLAHTSLFMFISLFRRASGRYDDDDRCDDSGEIHFLLCHLRLLLQLFSRAHIPPDDNESKTLCTPLSSAVSSWWKDDATSILTLSLSEQEMRTEVKVERNWNSLIQRGGCWLTG